MNLHKQIEKIQFQLEREERNPGLREARSWASPAEGKATKRRQLVLHETGNIDRRKDRGPLKINLIKKNGGYDSLIDRSISIQLKSFQEMLDGRIKDIEQEISK